MFKGFLSFIVTNLAIAVITLSLFAWMIDSTILQPRALLPALQKSGTPAAIAKAIPDSIETNATPADAAMIKEKVTAVVTEQYVNEKLTAIVTTFTSYIKTGKPEPSIDLSDVPAKLMATGTPVPPELVQKLSQPITITDKNATNSFANIRRLYQAMQMIKVFGPIVSIVLLAIDWLLAEKGRKTIRLGNIFASLTFWSGLYWFAVTKMPAVLDDKLANKGGTQGAAMTAIGTSIIHGLSGLFAHYLLVFTAVSAVGAFLFYSLHFILKALNKPKAQITAKASNISKVSNTAKSINNPVAPAKPVRAAK